MKTDVNGCSTTAKGTENFERFQSKVNGRYQWFYQYDYRTSKGNLFSCVKSTLAKCREARDKAVKNGTLE